jgi:hypothetical protein
VKSCEGRGWRQELSTKAVDNFSFWQLGELKKPEVGYEALNWLKNRQLSKAALSLQYAIKPHSYNIIK